MDWPTNWDAATLRAVRERLEKADGYSVTASICFEQFIEQDLDPMLAEAAGPRPVAEQDKCQHQLRREDGLVQRS